MVGDKAEDGQPRPRNEPPELRTHEDAQNWLETIGRAVATGRLSDRQAQAAIRTVAEWVKAEALLVEQMG